MNRLARLAMTLAIAHATLAYALARGAQDAPARVVIQDAPKAVMVQKVEVVIQEEKVIKAGEVEGVIVLDAPAVAPALMIRRAGIGNGNAEDLDPLIQQLTPQFRLVLRTEMHFLKSICVLSPEQHKALARDGEASLADAVRPFAAAQQKMMQGHWNTVSRVDPRRLVQKVILAAAKKDLSPEQVALYEAELDKRNDERKNVAVRCLVAGIDEVLILSADQRDKLVEALTRNWNEAWSGMIESSMNGNQSLPALPYQILGPILNPTQRRVWTSATTNQALTYSSMDFGMFDTFWLEADPIEEEVIKEAEKARMSGATPKN